MILLSSKSLATEFGPRQKHAQRILELFSRARPADERLRTGESITGGLSQFSSDENGTVPLRSATAISSPVLSSAGSLPHAEVEDAAAARSLISIHTYYALVVKLVALFSVSWSTKGRSILAPWASQKGDRLRRNLVRMEDGALFREHGIANFPGENPFDWYLGQWNPEMESALRDLVGRLADFQPASVPGDAARDLFKQLHHALLPRKVRHALGEYYTPDWLAQRLIGQTLGHDLGDPEKRALDPTCGSGTFLVLLIGQMRQEAARRGVETAETLDAITRNIVGLDLNPLAVLAARANYLVALGDLLGAASSIGPKGMEIPVHQFDCLLAAESHGPPRIEPADYVVGNPPWINWEHLSPAYRQRILPYYEDVYQLFPHKGLAARHGSAKIDLASLVAYATADKYLCDGGQLGFVLPQALFKSAAAGRGFRRFALPGGTPLAPLAVEDLAAVNPFPGAANRTVLAVFRKGGTVRYPVSYHVWEKRQMGRGGRIAMDAEDDSLAATIRVTVQWAEPVNAADATSAWLTAPRSELAAVKKVLGKSAYRGHEGANTGGANGVYWVRRMVAVRDGRVAVCNVTEGARRKVPQVHAAVEEELLFALLRGREVGRWRAQPGISILCPQDPRDRKHAIAEAEMAARFPAGLAYLRQFEPHLAGRPAFVKYLRRGGEPYYALYDIKDYTFTSWKVVWREQAARLTAAAVGPLEGRPVIPDHKLMFVETGTAAESHYLCALLNSAPAGMVIRAYTVAISIGTHILDHLRIPKYRATESDHARLARLSDEAHQAAIAGNAMRLQSIEQQVDECAARLWGLEE